MIHEKCDEQIEQLQAELRRLQALDQYGPNLEKDWQGEAERLRAELVAARSQAVTTVSDSGYKPGAEIVHLRAEVERLRADLDNVRASHKQIYEENERLRRDKANLRKAVTWLAGTVHDLHEVTGFTFAECDYWECKRARDRLNETREDA